MKILIIKTDRLGDFLNISSILKSLDQKKIKIDLICSEYNYELVKYYKFINKTYIRDNNLIKFIFKNKIIFKNKYDYLLQLDGNGWSFKTALLIKAKKKLSLRYIKNKKFLGLRFNIKRPNLLLKSFFITIDCIDNYNVKNNEHYRYLDLYHKVCELGGLSIDFQDHYFPLSDNYKRNIKIFDKYILIHFDEKWSRYDEKIFINFRDKIIKISENKKFIITSNKENLYLEHFDNINDNIKTVYDTNIKDMLFLTKNAYLIISSHSGFLIHLAACFKKQYIDILPINKFKEIDRWIPRNFNYKRYEFKHINDMRFNS